MLARVYPQELRAQAQVDNSVGLRGRQARCQQLRGVVADGFEGHGVRLAAGDICFRDGSAYLVRGAIRLDDSDIAELLVQALRLNVRISPMAAKFDVQAGFYRCAARGVRLASCWSISGEVFTIVGC